MSSFGGLIDAISSALTASSDAKTARTRRERARLRRRRRYNSPDTAEKGKRGVTRKDVEGDVNRRARFGADDLNEFGGDLKTKPYDPVFLRDISANAIVQAYIDTLAQDVAGANWSIKPTDEEADIDPETLAKVERRIRDLPPGATTFRDVLESTTRVMLELGDAAIVKHYLENDPNTLAEIVPIDSASLFKDIDADGMTQGYAQVSRRSRSKVTDFKPDEIIWFEWSVRSDRHYGQGPLEKAQNEVELIEELAEKERLDLMQGGPPGIISPEALDEYGGLPDDEDWETFVESMRLDAGERHRMGYSKHPMDYTTLNHNYQELQILDRSKYWVTAIGAVFKVNPTYAGFDFENTNRATDESQQDAYKQRGFRVTLRQLEEAINSGLIWQEFSDEIKFEFEQEQTIDEKVERANLIEAQANAGKEMADAGRDVAYRDERLVVEDGEIEEGSDDSGGGLFGSVDDPDFSTSKDGGVRLVAPSDDRAHSDRGEWESFLRDIANAGGRIIDTSNFDEPTVFPPTVPDVDAPRMVVYGVPETDILTHLERYPAVHLQVDTDRGLNEKSDDETDRDTAAKEAATIDGVLLKAFERQIMPPNLDAIEKKSWSSDRDVPDYVIGQIEEVIDRGSVFDSFDSLPGRAANAIRNTLSESLTQPQGWSLDSIVDNMSDALPRADKGDLETIARTESAKVLNEARETGYVDRGVDDAKFYWQGPDDSRTTDACEELKDMTNPSHGGEPVSLSKLIDAERAVQSEYFENLRFRKHILHPNERHTFVRDRGTGGPDIDVDVPTADDIDVDIDDPPVAPQSLSAKDDHDDDYADVVDRVAKATTPTTRMRELEAAFGGTHIPTVLRECLEASDGSKEGALRELNNRLSDADEYDVEERGKVSKPTLYNWIQRYDTHVDHLT